LCANFWVVPVWKISRSGAGEVHSPYINRFAQADTIIPPGMQGLDRYGYVNNSPVNFYDPTGHCPEEDDECRNRLAKTLPYTSGNNNRRKPPTRAKPNITDPEIIFNPFTTTLALPPIIKRIAPPSKNLSRCVSGIPCLINPVDVMNSSVAAQDAATMISIAGAGTQIAGAIVGCLATVEIGCVEGAIAGYIEAMVIYDIMPIPGIGLSGNEVQSYVSGTSTFITVANDLSTGDTSIKPL